MNFNQWYAKEEVDVLAQLDKLDKYRAIYDEQSKGIRQSKYAYKRRLKSTNTYCQSQMKTYDELLRVK